MAAQKSPKQTTDPNNTWGRDDHPCAWGCEDLRCRFPGYAEVAKAYFSEASTGGSEPSTANAWGCANPWCCDSRDPYHAWGFERHDTRGPDGELLYPEECADAAEASLSEASTVDAKPSTADAKPSTADAKPPTARGRIAIELGVADLDTLGDHRRRERLESLERFGKATYGYGNAWKTQGEKCFGYSLEMDKYANEIALTMMCELPAIDGGDLIELKVRGCKSISDSGIVSYLNAKGASLVELTLDREPTPQVLDAAKRAGTTLIYQPFDV